MSLGSGPVPGLDTRSGTGCGVVGIPPRVRLLAGVSVAAGVGAVLAGVALLVAAGYLVARAAARPPILDLAVVFVAVRFFGLARPALRYAERLASHDATLRWLRHVRRWFCEACLPLSPARLLDWRSGDLMARVANDVDTLQDAFLRVTAPAAIAIVVSLVSAAVLFTFDPLLAAIFVSVVLLNGVLVPILGRRGAAFAGLRGEPERRGSEQEHAALTADLVTMLRAHAEVAAFGQEDAQAQRVAERQGALDAWDRRDAAIEACCAAATTIVAGLGVAAVLAVLAVRVQEGAIGGVWAVALTLGLLGALEAIDGLPQAWRARERVAAAARRVFEITSAAPAVVEAAAPERWTASSHAPSLRLDRVTFGYGDVPLLDAASLAVQQGEHVAIVGPTGAGKSTLLSLICRFRDVQAGKITIDGRDIRGAARADLRAAMALVPQEVHVLDASLRDNVRFARADASDEDIRGVLRAVGLGGLAASRDGGLDAPMGEEGLRLSAGERQRLGIARVMLTAARLVLVDEPTAHLDVETERDVLAALREWARGRTLIVVSHRLSTVRRFDRLAVMERGRLAAAGRHDQLLAAGGVYGELWAAERRMLAHR